MTNISLLISQYLISGYHFKAVRGYARYQNLTFNCQQLFILPFLSSTVQRMLHDKFRLYIIILTSHTHHFSKKYYKNIKIVVSICGVPPGPVRNGTSSLKWKLLYQNFDNVNRLLMKMSMKTEVLCRQLMVGGDSASQT
jgi:hypothetical protein